MYFPNLRTERHGGSRATPSIIKITTSSGQPMMSLYVKSAASKHGSQGHFWGINENQIRSLNSKPLPWWLVLLMGSAERCYLSSGDKVYQLMEARTLSYQDSRHEHKIHEDQISGKWQKYPTFVDLFEALRLPKG
jgi:hypothetical protein